MGLDYLVCGVPIRSAFPLDGLRPAGHSPDEAVRLELVDAAGFERGWSGSATDSSWRGRLRDGEELRVEWGGEGELRLDYGSRARFQLTPDRQRLDCLLGDPTDLAVQRVLLTRVLPLVAIARGAEALHAGAIEGADGVVAILGASGAGKSTLTATLVDRGHPLFADDVLVLDRGPAAVRGHAASPHLSLAPDGPLPGRSLGELGGKRWVVVDPPAETSAPLAALVILDRDGAGPPRVERLPASPLSLAPFMLGLPDDDGREEARFGLYADLVAEAPLLRLSAAPDDPPAAIAAVLEAALEASRPTARRAA